MAGLFGPDWTGAGHWPVPSEPARARDGALVLRGGHHDVQLTGVHRWRPQRDRAFFGGGYAIAVHGDRFVIGESAKVGSFDELRRLLQEGTSG